MNELKYVIVIPRGMNVYGARAILFNGMLNHADVVEATLKRGAAEVYSAGFCAIKRGKVNRVWGHSSSLDIGSKPNDDAIIMRTLDGRHTAFDLMAFDND